ncbi:MAG: putative phosphoribosyl transferase [Promethearchaeota archaeon]|nr:MAG: putative phosphoribosyl transferase [Candidatus Lokiarchaeota archaeon]
MSFKRYDSRVQAGKILVEFINNETKEVFNYITNNPHQCFCFAIPNGGVPVAEGFCSELGLNYDLLIVRKIKIPYNLEAGFGSMTPDGTVLLNDELLSYLNLSQEDINRSTEITRKEIENRLAFYNKQYTTKEDYRKRISQKMIFLLDDGLASGFTMLAAIKMVKQYEPKQIFLAVPTAPLKTTQRLGKEVDKIYCPNVRNARHFAVAEAYKNWYDLSESEILKILNTSEYYNNKPFNYGKDNVK